MASLRCTAIAQPCTQRHTPRCLIRNVSRGNQITTLHAPKRLSNPMRVRPHPATVPAAAVANDVQGDMLVPSVANKNWVRVLALTAAVAATARGVGYLPAQGVAFVHLLALASWLGSTVWVTFIAGLTMFRNMPRQLFGKVQAKLFPQYFALHAGSALIILGCHLWGGMGDSGAAAKVVLSSLGTALGASLINLVVLEPKATAVMFQRYALENAPVRDEARIKQLVKEFGKFHGISSLVNLVGMVAGVAYVWWLAGRLAL